MRFCVNESPSHLGGQRLLWNLLGLALEGEPGVAYFRYPLYRPAAALPAPECLVLSRRFGFVLLTCSGVRRGGLQSFDAQGALERGQIWLEELERRIESEPDLRGLALGRAHRLVLPFVDEKSWQAHAAAHESAVRGAVLLREQLQPRLLLEMFAANAREESVLPTDSQWRLLEAVMRGRISPLVSSGPPAAVRDPTDPLGSMLQVERRPGWLDEVQERVAREIPEGPQRIRGVAGSGKTLLLAQRAALIHAAHPDWVIAFLLHTRHRRAEIQGLITACFEDLTGRPPNLSHLRVWHAWGDDASPGFLRTAAEVWGQRRLGASDAQYRLGWREAESRGLAWASEELERDLCEQGDREVTPLFDAVLIDEGQDVPAALFRLALRSLRPPRRLYWAFDESQGLHEVSVPRAAELFGLDATGRPRVDLAGYYPSGIPKSRQLSRSYRTPSGVLGVAQALGMGLLRRGGPLQAVTHRDEWANLGFQVEGDLSAAGIRARRPLLVERGAQASGHPVDHLDYDEDEAPPQWLEVIEVEEEQAAVAAIVAGIRRDLEIGLEPEDLLVIAMPQAQPTLAKLRVAFDHAGIAAHVLADDREGVAPRRSACVTLASVEVARGLEAWKVYVCGLHRVTAESVTNDDDEMLRRNQVLLAMTRTRLWCVAIGEKGPFMTEAMALLRHGGRFRFPAFDASVLHRDISSWVLGGVGEAERMIELN